MIYIMLEAFLKVSPIFFIFLLGFFLKRSKLFKTEDGGLLLRLVFFVASPALIYLSVSKLDITPNLIAFPVIAAAVIVLLHGVNALTTQNMTVPRQTLGVYRVGTLIANTAFALPFLLAVYGHEAAAKVAMYDLTGGFLTYVFVYSIAVRHGDGVSDKKFILQKIFLSPPVWALTLGLIANILHIHTPEIAVQILESLAALVSPLVMLALGLYFSPRLVYPKLLSMALLTRMAGGFMIGYVVSGFFGLSGWERAAAIIMASAPVGFNTLVYANIENLDTKFATSLLSCAIAVGLIVIPLLTVLFTH